MMKLPFENKVASTTRNSHYSFQSGKNPLIFMVTANHLCEAHKKSLHATARTPASVALRGPSHTRIVKMALASEEVTQNISE